MVGRYIPILMGLGAILVAYRFVGIDRILEGLRDKQLEDSYDYIIGESVFYISSGRRHIMWIADSSLFGMALREKKENEE